MLTQTIRKINNYKDKMIFIEGVSVNDVTLLDSSANVKNMMAVDDSTMSKDNIWTSSKIDDTYQKKTTATVGSLLTVDATGNIVDAGIIPGIRPGITGILNLNSSLNIDNLSIQIRQQSIGIWIFAATVSGTTTFAYSLMFQLSTTGGLTGTIAANTTFQPIGANNYSFNQKAFMLTVILSDLTIKKMYRITWQITANTTPWNNNYVSIERLN